MKIFKILYIRGHKTAPFMARMELDRSVFRPRNHVLQPGWAPFLFLVCMCLFIPVDLPAEEAPPRIDSNQLKNTVITAYLQQEIPADKNLIYCSAFQIAWDKLCDDIIKGPLELSGSPPTGRMLNERLSGAEEISEDCYLAMAGYKKDNIEERIAKAMKEKFNEAPTLDITLQRPDDILAYAFLFKDLRFSSEFEKIDNPIFFKGSAPVQAFGIKKYSFSEEYRKLSGQLDILDYQSDDDFIIALKSLRPNDEIIFAKIHPKDTLLATVESVSSRIANKVPSSIEKDEVLMIPKLDYDILHSYNELVGKNILNKGFEDKFIAKAVQSIRFRIDEKGVILKSEAAMVAMTAMPGGREKTRSFIFDKPFLILLKEKGARYPYFAMWVDNTELLK